MSLMPAPAYLVGVDIGGTKIKSAPVSTGASPRVADGATELPTPKLSPERFYDALAASVRQVAAQAQHAGLRILPLAAVAHPGRFLPDGTLARGTTPNLGTRPGEFDGRAPARELERRLGGWTVVAENDAVAQMRYGLLALLRDRAARAQLLGHRVVYLGPGTGMGGGVARIDAQGGVTPITDGHLFDLLVPHIGGGTLTAEEVFTGPAMARDVARANAALSEPIEPARGGTLDEILLNTQAPAAHRRAAEEIADVYGGILARIIEAVHAGRIVKVRVERSADGRVIGRHVDEPDRAWGAQDIDAVRGVTRFLFGGFMGCSRGLGPRIRARALAELQRRGLPDAQIFQVPATSGDAGVLGIASAVPEELIRRAGAGSGAAG
jgi:predicted NBD/HSP70 family sugar kinase